MDGFTKQEIEEAEGFAEFFIDLLENKIEFSTYCLAETSVLDWFGQTVKGEKNIVNFMKKHIPGCKHVFPNIKPTKSIGFRETHVIKMPTSLKIPPPIDHASSDNSDEQEQVAITPTTNSPHTPRNQILERGQGDGFHNICSPPIHVSHLNESDTSESGDLPDIKYVTMEGAVEFRRASSKKYQAETKWQRSCKLQVAYTGTDESTFTILLIIYEGTTNCRRNLLKEFDMVAEKR